MIVCVHCKLEMKCVENGYGVRFGTNHVYPGDLYQCPHCDLQIIKTGPNSTHDDDQKIKTLQMPEKTK